MSKKNPHVIMGQTVNGSSKKGLTVQVKYYESESDKAYKPKAQDMLDELANEISRLDRVYTARAYKLNHKLAENS
ncbi:hypothetical protein NQU96_12425 [Pseudoalteromonas elyakovii]|nr:hypothetical protein [Pseudoalteromonas elyakovii]